MEKNIFKLDNEQLKAIARSFKEKVEKGLNTENAEIQCIPTFITPKADNINGKSLVLDLGGTNYRVALVDFSKSVPDIHPNNGWKKDMSIMKSLGYTQEELFKELADMITGIKREEEMPIGYCFSYPTESVPGGDAKLLRWTKGVDIKEMIGKYIGNPLLNYLNEKNKIKFTDIKVLNDTVASLFAGLTDNSYDAYIGLIVGTGTNMATFIPADKIKKLNPADNIQGMIPVNLESGNFHPPFLTGVDNTVDVISDKNYGRFTAGLAHTVLLKLYMLTKQWDKAEAEGRELMKPEYGFELVPEYKDIFTLANEKNPEIIWACQCAKGYQEHKWQPHVLPNDYNFTSYLDKMTKWNGYKISWDFMQTFDPADRRLLTIAYEYTSKDGVVHNEKNDRPDPSAQLYLGAVPLKYEFDPDCTGEDSQIDWIIYRYADVLTLTAEAIVRNKNAVTQEAVNLLNEVRTRSLPGKGYSLQDLNSVDKFLKAVLDERGWELYFEGNRRQDLIRYGLFVEAIKKKAQSMGKQTLVDEDRYRFPIPQDIIDEGKGIIKQNPGY